MSGRRVPRHASATVTITAKRRDLETIVLLSIEALSRRRDRGVEAAGDRATTAACRLILAQLVDDVSIEAQTFAPAMA